MAMIAHRIVLVSAVLQASAGAVAAQGLTDRFGDPLPDGAVARLGTLRWRHGGAVTTVAFPDNKTLVSRGRDGFIRLWEVPSGKQRRHYPGGYYDAVAVAADGKTLAGVNWDNEIQLYETATGRVLRGFGKTAGRMIGHDPTARVALSNDGNWLVYFDGGEITVWELDGAKPRHRIQPATPSLDFVMALSDDGKLLAVAEQAGGIRLWNLESGKEHAALLGHKNASVYALAFDPRQPKILVSAGNEGVIRFWDVQAGREIDRLERKAITYGLAFSPDGSMLAVQEGLFYPHGHVPRLLLLDSATKKEIRRFTNTGALSGKHGSIAFSPDGGYVACGNLGSMVAVWETATGKAVLDPGQQWNGSRSAVLSRDGKWVATESYGEVALVWDLEKGTEVARLAAPKGDLGGRPLAFTGDSKCLLTLVPSGLFYRFVWRWDVAAGKAVGKAPGEYESVLPAILAPDGRTLLLFNQGLRLRDLETGKDVGQFDTSEDWEAWGPMAFSRDGKLLANWSGTWEIASGKKLHRLRKDPWWKDGDSYVRQLDFSPDGKLLASVTPGKVVVHALGKKEPLHVFDIKSFKGSAVAFAPDSKLLASADQGILRLWDVATGKSLGHREGHRGEVTSLSFTVDGRRLVSVSEDTTLLVWDVDALVKAPK
jgi:WD40 repeat protein